MDTTPGSTLAAALRAFAAGTWELRYLIAAAVVLFVVALVVVRTEAA